MAYLFSFDRARPRTTSIWHLFLSALILLGLTSGARAAELTFDRAYQGSLSGQTFTTTSQLVADPGSVRFADGGTQRAFQNTSGTLYYTVGGVQHSETGVLNSRYPNGSTLMDAVAFSGTGGDRLLALGPSYTGSSSYSGSSNAIVAKLNEYIGATAPDPAQTTIQVNGGSSASVSVGQSATILVTVKLGSGTAVSGAVVSLSASSSGTSTISPASATTNSSGQASFTVQGTSAGTVTYQAVASANGTTTTSSSSVSVTFVGVRSAAQSSATVPAGTAGTATTVTVAVKDSAGNPVSGAASGLSASIGGTNSGAAPSSITDQGGGAYTFSYVPATAGNDTVAITLDGTAIAGSPYTSVVSAPTLSFAPSAGTLPGGTVGTSYSQTIAISGGTSPYAFTATGLPAGLTINSATGVTGTPTMAGSYSVSISVIDAHGATGTAAYTLGIAVQAPTAGAVSLSVAANSSNNAVTLSLSGGTATSVAVASQPAHGSAAASGTSITYTPTTGYSGSDSFTYTATNASGTSAAATITVTVSAPTLTFTPAPGSLPGGTVGTAYSQILSAAGGTTPYSFGATGLPAGLAIDPATGTVSGTPTTTGTYPISISVTDAHGATGSGSYSIVIAVLAPVANAASATIAANSSNNAITLPLSGGAAASVAVASQASHGTAGASGTSITYTPTAGYSGSDSFTYTATNASGTSSPATVSLIVTAAPLVFTPSAGALPNGTVGTAYSQSISVSAGTAPYSFSAIGLPAGLTLNASTGAITGMPTTAGTYTVNVSVTDAHGGPGIVTYTLVVAAQAPVAGATSITVAANSSNNAVALPLSGGPAASVAIGSQASHGTATASGTTIVYAPSAGFSGSDSFTYTATNASGTSAPATVTVTVSAPTLTFGPAPGALPGGSAGTTYSQAISVSGGTAPYHFTATGLPAGLAVNPATGAVTGIPTAAGTYQISITVTDAQGASGTAAYTLVIAAPPPPAAADSTSTSVPANTRTEAGQNVGVNLSSLVTGQYDEIRILTQPQHGTVTISKTLAMRGGGASGLMMAALTAAAPIPSQVIAVYTPQPEYVGPDSFEFAAVGPGGISAPATVAIQVIGHAPAAQAQKASTIDGQPVSVELTAGAVGGPFTGAAIVSISPRDQATANIVPGGGAAAGTFRLDVTPKAHFGGTVTIGYTLTNAFGTSATALVTIQVTRRPDPSADPVVQAVSDAQAETARRFSRAQVSNFMQRAESLHGDCARSTNGIHLSSTDGGYNQASDAGPERSPSNSPSGAGGSSAADKGASTEGHDTGSGSCSNGVAVWTGGTVDIGTRDAVTGRSKINATTAGLSAGIDSKVSRGATLGVGGGLGRDRSTISDGAAHVAASTRAVAIYGSAAPVAGIFLDGMVAHGWLDFDVRRTDATTSQVTSGKRDGRFTTGALSFGVDRNTGRLEWSAYGRAEYLTGRLDAYAEQGAGIYDLRFDAKDIKSTTGVLGFRMAYRQPTSFGILSARVRGEWQHEFTGGTRQGLDYADVDGPSFFSLQEQGWSREQFLLTPGLELTLPSQWAIGLNLGVRAAAGERAATTAVQLRKQF